MTGPTTSVASVQEALDRGDHQEVLRLTDALLAERPGDDAAHELRARALLALGRIDEAERHAADAVRLDPDEIRYRELLAQVLAARGAHRDAAAEYGRLARNDPRQRDWLLAEAGERLDAAQAGRAAEAARAAVRLDPADAQAQLTLATTLARLGDGAGAMAAAASADRLLPGDPRAAEALADADWLLGQDASAFGRLADLAKGLQGRRWRACHGQGTGPLPAARRPGGQAARRHITALRRRPAAGLAAPGMTGRREPLTGGQPTTAGLLRDHLAAALRAAMRRPEPEAVAITADRTKAMAVALAGLPDDAAIELAGLELPTRQVATVLGFHPEHVRRLIRSGRLRARRVGGDYRVSLDDLWALLEVRYREPGRRRLRPRR